MARIIFDGFDHGSFELWNGSSGSLNANSKVTGVYSIPSPASVTKNISVTTLYDVYLGFWISNPSLTSNTSEIYITPAIYPFPEYLFQSGFPYVRITYQYNSGSGSGTLYISAGGSSILSGYSFYYPTNHIQIRLKSNQDLSVLVQAKFNGELVANETLASPMGNGLSGGYIRQISINNSSGAGFLDDIVIDDADWPGPSRIYTLSPNGAGNSTVWQPSSGDNWECVNDIPAGSYDYVSADDALDLDLYSLGNLPAGVTSVKNVQVMATTKTPGPPSLEYLQLALRTGGANHYSSSKKLYYNYRIIQNTWALNPQTGAAWTAAEINALEAGMRLVSS